MDEFRCFVLSDLLENVKFLLADFICDQKLANSGDLNNGINSKLIDCLSNSSS